MTSLSSIMLAAAVFLLVVMLTALPPAQLASRLPAAGVLRRD